MGGSGDKREGCLLPLLSQLRGFRICCLLLASLLSGSCPCLSPTLYVPAHSSIVDWIDLVPTMSRALGTPLFKGGVSGACGPPTCPFALQLPYLIDGAHKVTQSNAILRYIARKHNLCEWGRAGCGEQWWAPGLACGGMLRASLCCVGRRWGDRRGEDSRGHFGE